MIKFTFDNNTYSDLFKDAFGFRPSQDQYRAWDLMSDEDKQNEWDYLIRVLEENIKREKIEQDHAIAALEQRIADCLSLGAVDRDAAIRWIAESEECTGDQEHLEWKLGVPFGYLSQHR